MRRTIIALASIFAVSFVFTTALAVSASDSVDDLTLDSADELTYDIATEPTLVRQPSPSKVVAEHLNALKACSLERIMAQYPNKAEVHLPNGVVVKGRTHLRALFSDIVKPHDQGGLCGISFTPEYVSRVGKTINVQWRAEAPFLAEPYRGSDAYETKDGLMYAQVTTFKSEDLKFKQ